MSKVSWWPVPGVRLGTVKAGVKYPDRRDLVLMEVAPGTRAAGVFTRNRFRAAPVEVAERHLAAAAPRYLLINTGYANAGTGEAGLRAAETSCDLVAEETQCQREQILPFSTGVIGEPLPLEPFRMGIPRARGALSEHGWGEAAEGIMTTDTRPKIASRRAEIHGHTVTVTGMAKGAGMLKPDMGTMLAYIATDAAVAPDLLDQWLRELTDASFNAITVDGDTSTNDACMLLATGQSELAEITEPDSDAARALYEELAQVFEKLAQALVRDAEGATKFVEIRVDEARDSVEARAVADTIAHSPLVKTALFASDPNWGRILAAVGRAPVADLDVSRVHIWLGDVLLVENGGVAPGYREADGAAVMARDEIGIHVSLGAGTASARVWTCDFSYDYVRINAEYRS
jgi:glutamate N-acetyltransferase/amino-acid N-acetyltransferase